jgi:hypothetical protein
VDVKGGALKLTDADTGNDWPNAFYDLWQHRFRLFLADNRI